MKVLFTMDALINAGTEKSVLDIVSHFSPSIKVKVAYFYPRHDLKDAYEKAGIELIFLDLKGKRSFGKGIKKLKKLVRDEKPDVVVSSIFRANIMSRIACRLTNTKLVGTFVSDSYAPERQKSFSSKRKAGSYFFYWLDRLTAHIPKAWISNSISIKESNCRFLKIDPAIVHVIYRGRDPGKFREKDDSMQRGMFRFIFVGRLLETKGLKELTDAFKIISAKYPSATLDVYGEGPFRNIIAQHITLSGLNDKVILHGAVSDGWEKLYHADCFVFPSWYEGFSGSLVEAMMVGIPIIASDITMNQEAVTSGTTALLHKVRDVNDLADKMRSAIESYPAMIEMGRRARKEAIERFDINVIAGEYENILKSI